MALVSSSREVSLGLNWHGWGQPSPECSCEVIVDPEDCCILVQWPLALWGMHYSPGSDGAQMLCSKTGQGQWVLLWYCYPSIRWGPLRGFCAVVGRVSAC